MEDSTTAYPATLSIDYPDRDLNRLTTFFRIFTLIPIAVVLVLMPGGAAEFQSTQDRTGFQLATSGLVFLPTLLMVLFRQKYPKWWFDWNLALFKFANRVFAYLALL